MSKANKRVGGIYNLPGEGLVIEVYIDGAMMLFDRQGLQHRLLSRQQKGLDVTTEEAALAQLNSVSPHSDPSDH